MRRASMLLALVLAASAFAPRAQANGRIPEANQLIVDETDPSFLLLRVTFGLLVSRDRGKTWDWICESALGNQGTFDPPVAIAAGKTLIAGTVNGLAISDDTGCTWLRRPPIENRFILDVATFPGAPNEVVAITNDGVSDAGPFHYDSFLARSSDGAKTWAITVPPLDPTLVIDTVDFAKSDPKRIYVTARHYEPKLEAFLLVSTDGGATFVSRPIPFEDTDRGAYIGAVDPTSADRVYVRVSATGESGTTIAAGRLLVTDDAGKTWTERWRGGPPLGFALSPDGKKVWVGSSFGGLYAADTTSFAFVERQPFNVKCLTATNDRLYACSDEFVPADAAPRVSFVLGESLDDGATFSSVYKLKEIRGPLACANGTTTAKCVAEWPKLKVDLAIDAGTTPPPTPTPAPDGCGCRSAFGAEAGAGSGAALVIVLALALGRRRRS